MANQKQIVKNGVTITDPYLDETGRFSVDPETYYGLTQEEIKQLKGNK